MKYVLIGKAVNTHGLKGEIRILSSFKYKNKIFIPGMNLYFGNEKTCEKIVTYRHHKNFEMITLDGYSDIDQVLKYKGSYVFANRDDISLGKNEYLDEDIIGRQVYIDDRLIGNVKKIENHNGNEILVVSGGDREYLIPYNFDIVISINLNKDEIKVKNIIGLVD